MAGRGSRAEARRHRDSSRRASLEFALRPMCGLLLKRCMSLSPSGTTLASLNHLNDLAHPRVQKVQ